MTVVRDIPPAFDTAPQLAAGRMAKDALARVADGNGLMATQIRIAREDSAIHRLQGEISVALSHRLQRDQVKGHDTNGTQVASEAEARSRAAARTEQLVHDAAFRQLIATEINRLPAHGWGATTLRFTLGRAADDVFAIFESCAACATKPAATCAICGGSGQTTTRLTARYTAEITFTLWRQGFDVLALEAAEKLGITRMASDDLADIYIGTLEADGTRLRANCTALLHVAKVDLSLEGRFVTALIAGKKGEIVRLDPILDKFIKPGVAALLKLSRGPLAVESLLSTALKYRAVRQAVHGVMLYPRAAVYRQLQRDYPIGISDKYLRAAVKYAAAAQGALIHAPRLKAARIATLVGVVIIAAYLFALRPLMTQAQIALGVDVALLLALCAGSAEMIRSLTARALTQLVRAAKGPAYPPAAGSAAVTSWLVMIVSFAALSMAAPAKPIYGAWLLSMLHRVFPSLVF